MTSFDGFGLNDTITRTIAEEEHATSTPIQAPTVPVVMSRRDIIVVRLYELSRDVVETARAT